MMTTPAKPTNVTPSDGRHAADCFLVEMRRAIMDRQGDKKQTGVPDSFCTCGLTAP